jgi:hypothetical protein
LGKRICSISAAVRKGDDRAEQMIEWFGSAAASQVLEVCTAERPTAATFLDEYQFEK